MSRQGLERAANFLNNLEEKNKLIIGNFCKYTVFIQEDDGPYFYIEYLAESEWDDILYRFNLLKPEYDGIGEFEDWEDLIYFLEENWIKIIYNYNVLNDGSITNNGIIKYN